MLKLRSALAVVAVTMGGTAVADIINVGPGDSIQAAIDAAVDGDEIVVFPGTYFETINFLGKAITLRSSDGAGVTPTWSRSARRTSTPTARSTYST